MPEPHVVFGTIYVVCLVLTWLKRRSSSAASYAMVGFLFGYLTGATLLAQWDRPLFAIMIPLIGAAFTSGIAMLPLGIALYSRKSY